MSDEKPPRVRGLKEQEAAYRAGFVDGLAHAHAELAEQRALEQKRDAAIGDGLARLRTTPVTPRRTRRRRGNPDVSLEGAQAGNL